MAVRKLTVQDETRFWKRLRLNAISQNSWLYVYVYIYMHAGNGPEFSTVSEYRVFGTQTSRTFEFKKHFETRIPSQFRLLLAIKTLASVPRPDNYRSECARTLLDTLNDADKYMYLKPPIHARIDIWRAISIFARNVREIGKQWRKRDGPLQKRRLFRGGNAKNEEVNRSIERHRSV